jgi:hypothetical protein
MKTRLALALLLVVCGCSTPPAGAPSELKDGFRREGHPAFSPQEQKIVAAARHRIEETCGRRIDAYYRVRHTPQGYSVLALEVYGYDRNQPGFGPGRSWDVDLQEDGTVISVFRGH